MSGYPPRYGDLDAFKNSYSADLLTVGQETMHRRFVVTQSATMATQLVRFTYFTARKTETITQLRSVSGGTAAGATPTLAKMGLCSVAANGDLTLIGSTPNTTTLWAAATTAYQTAMSASASVVAGQRYAFAALIVSGATIPTLLGSTAVIASEQTLAPRLTASLAAQSDLPASVASASLGTTPVALYGVLVP